MNFTQPFKTPFVGYKEYTKSALCEWIETSLDKNTYWLTISADGYIVIHFMVESDMVVAALHM